MKNSPQQRNKHKGTTDLTQSMYRQYHPFAADRNPPLQEEKRQAARLVAEEIAGELYKTFGAVKVVLFGSLARGQFSPRSDIDLAAWGIPPALFYRAVAFATGYSDTWTVDLIDADDAPKTLLLNIKNEGIAL